MAWVAADWSIDRATGNIRYIGDAHGGASPSYVAGIDWYREIGKFGDDLVSSGDDEYDITDKTFGARSTDFIFTLQGIYNIDQTASEHIYDATIIQGANAERWDSIVNYGNPAHIEIVQDGAIIANDFWNSFGSAGFNPDATNGISHRFLIKVRTGSADIDGRKLLGQVREFNYTYGEFKINGTSLGLNTLALSEKLDLNNETTAGTVATWTTIVNDNEGYVGIDADGNAANEFYYSNWELAARTKNEFYERLKWLTRRGSAETIYGLSGELFRGITHEITIDTPTGTFQEPEALSWTGGTGQLLAIDSVTAGTKMWIQLLTGSAPTDNTTITGGTSTATADVNVTVVERTPDTPFVGASTGTAIIGSYGLGIGADDLTASDKLIDLTNTQRIPPNNVTVTLNGLVSGEDAVIMTNNNAGDVDYAQFTLQTNLTTDNVTSVVITTTIPSDTPTTGYIRVQDDNGRYRRLHYSSRATNTFTIDETSGEEDFATVNATNPRNVYLEYISTVAGSTSESVTYVHSGSDRTFFVRVRDGGTSPTKTFETIIVGSPTGQAVTIQRQPDD